MATTVKNFLLFDLGLCFSLPTIVIPALTGIGNIHNSDEYLTVTPVQASWLGKFNFDSEKKCESGPNFKPNDSSQSVWNHLEFGWRSKGFKCVKHFQTSCQIELTFFCTAISWSRLKHLKFVLISKKLIIFAFPQVLLAIWCSHSGVCCRH